MAGETENPEQPDSHAPQPGQDPGTLSERPDNQPPKPAKPRVKTFHCTNCGASVTVRYPGQSLSVVCESCHSVIDANDPYYKVLAKSFAKTALYKPQIPLGTRGKLKGRTWEAIGFMVRSDMASSYDWREYLLFNPYYGYRWLLEDNGHWSFVTPIKDKPDDERAAQAILNKKSYRIFNRGKAKVDYVIGEFYWQVAVDSQVLMTDYICPPEMLSRERDDNEITWSLSEYTPRDEIKNAFKLDYLPPPLGVAPNEPVEAVSTWIKVAQLWLVFVAILTFVQVAQAFTASNLTVYTGNYPLSPNGKTSDLTTPVFTLKKDMANVKVEFAAPVSNSWFWVSGELVNNKTGDSYYFERSVEYYFGTDSDGAWSEGGSTNDILISSVPAGDYYLNMDTESGDFKDTIPRQYTVFVSRDVTTYANYFWCLFFVSIVPSLCWINQRTFEVQRWSNSDFSPYRSASSD